MTSHIVKPERKAKIKFDNNLKLIGLTVVNFTVNLNNKKRIKIWVITVATAAPYKLNLGIKIQFKITLIIAPARMAQKVLFCRLKTTNI